MFRKYTCIQIDVYFLIMYKDFIKKIISQSVKESNHFHDYLCPQIGTVRGFASLTLAKNDLFVILTDNKGGYNPLNTPLNSPIVCPIYIILHLCADSGNMNFAFNRRNGVNKNFAKSKLIHMLLKKNPFGWCQICYIDR